MTSFFIQKSPTVAYLSNLDPCTVSTSMIFNEQTSFILAHVCQAVPQNLLCKKILSSVRSRITFISSHTLSSQTPFGLFQICFSFIQFLCTKTSTYLLLPYPKCFISHILSWPRLSGLPACLKTSPTAILCLEPKRHVNILLSWVTMISHKSIPGAHTPHRYPIRTGCT